MTAAPARRPRLPPPTPQAVYESLLAEAADPMSSLYHLGKPHRGDVYQAAFWDGYAQFKRTVPLIPGTLRAASFAAGRAFARTRPGVSLRDAVWTPSATPPREQVLLGPALASARVPSSLELTA